VKVKEQSSSQTKQGVKQADRPALVDAILPAASVPAPTWLQRKKSRLSMTAGLRATVATAISQKVSEMIGGSK